MCGCPYCALPTASATIRLVPRTVLIVDDHPSFRASARAILEADGFTVIGEAADGHLGPGGTAPAAAGRRPARRAAARHDGLRRLRRVRDLDTTSVVLVSSRDATDYGSLIASSGARGFIAKAELSGDALVNLLP